jgi:hypothetical protein
VLEKDETTPGSRLPEWAHRVKSWLLVRLSTPIPLFLMWDDTGSLVDMVLRTCACVNAGVSACLSNSQKEDDYDCYTGSDSN